MSRSTALHRPLTMLIALAATVVAGCATAPPPKPCPRPEPCPQVACAPCISEQADSDDMAVTKKKQLEVIDAVLAAFPEAYSELSKVTWIRTDKGWLDVDSVTFLVPAAKTVSWTPELLAERACSAKKPLGMDCACERVRLGEPKEYAWWSWPDKTVIEVTLDFLNSC